MPNNIRQVKDQILARAKSAKAGAQIQKVVATSVMKNLARFTPVDEGFLAGGWSVITKPGQTFRNIIKRGQKRTGFINRSRHVSLQNTKRIDNINGKKTVLIGNGVFYGPDVNFGTRKQRAQKFRETAVRTSILELKKKGLNVKVE